uniref:Secreted protein n=1 Tax=Ixodes ricinus TaxID=34613 RepID=A0A6B0UTJ0_IXORI
MWHTCCRRLFSLLLPSPSLQFGQVHATLRSLLSPALLPGVAPPLSPPGEPPSARSGDSRPPSLGVAELWPGFRPDAWACTRWTCCPACRCCWVALDTEVPTGCAATICHLVGSLGSCWNCCATSWPLARAAWTVCRGLRGP